MSYSISGKARVVRVIDASIVKSNRFTQLVEMLRKQATEEDLSIEVECVKPLPRIDRDLINMFDRDQKIMFAYSAILAAMLANENDFRARFRCAGIVASENEAFTYATLIAIVALGAEIMPWKDPRTGENIYIIYSRGLTYYSGRRSI